MASPKKYCIFYTGFVGIDCFPKFLVRPRLGEYLRTQLENSPLKLVNLQSLKVLGLERAKSIIPQSHKILQTLVWC